MASTTVVENIKLDTQISYAERSETPSPTGPLLVTPPNYQLSGSGPMSTTWLKLNSMGPIRVRVEQTTEVLDDEPFAGAKKLRFLLENTDELVVCPGVYDGLSARTAIELGFKSLYMVSNIILYPALQDNQFHFPPFFIILGLSLLMRLFCLPLN